MKRKELAIFVILVLLVVGSALINPKVLSIENFQNTSRLVGMYGIFSIGMGLVIITGGIDLSIGSMFALLGVIFVMLLEKKFPPILSLSAVLAGGAGIGWLHGFLVTRVKIQPFVVTLCGLLFYRGMARTLTGDQTKGFGAIEGIDGLKALSGSIGPIPVPLILLAITSVIFYFVLHRSVFGRHLYAAGKNEEAARYAGINSKRVITIVYVLCGFLGAISAVLFGFYTNSIAPSSHGNFYELYAVAAAVLGGCSLRGGEGSIIGILLGTILLQVLKNLVNMLHVPSQLEFAVIGIVILIGVLADSFFSKPRKVATA